MELAVASLVDTPRLPEGISDPCTGMQTGATDSTYDEEGILQSSGGVAAVKTVIVCTGFGMSQGLRTSEGLSGALMCLTS